MSEQWHCLIRSWQSGDVEECVDTPISAEQAALGAMTDGEVGLMLIHRHLRDLPDGAWHNLVSRLEGREKDFANFLPRPYPFLFAEFAKKLGLWPREGSERT